MNNRRNKMPRYEFNCEECNEIFDIWSTMAEKDENVKKSKCPNCESKKINEILGCSVKFANPIGTDRWNSDSKGHDYRHKYNMDRPGGVRDQRKHAETNSHVGKDPYRRIDDVSSGKHFGEVK
jgi:putative FmdB family regulatory protein